MWPECILGAKLRHSTVGPTCFLSTSLMSPMDSGLILLRPSFPPNVGHPQVTPSLTWETIHQPTLILVWDTLESTWRLGTVPSLESIEGQRRSPFQLRVDGLLAQTNSIGTGGQPGRGEDHKPDLAGSGRCNDRLCQAQAMCSLNGLSLHRGPVTEESFLAALFYR